MTGGRHVEAGRIQYGLFLNDCYKYDSATSNTDLGSRTDYYANNSSEGTDIYLGGDCGGAWMSKCGIWLTVVKHGTLIKPVTILGSSHGELVL